MYPHTLEEFDWSVIADKYSFATQDKDGSIWVWVEEPTLDGSRWMPPPMSGRDNPEDFYKYKDTFHQHGKDTEFVGYRSAIISRTGDRQQGCKHAAEMMQYALDAAKYEKPWELWEVVIDGIKAPLLGHPGWSGAYVYTRKSPTVTLTISREVALSFITGDRPTELVDAIKNTLKG